MKEIADILGIFPYAHHAYGIESYDIIHEYIKKFIPKNECSYIISRHYDSFKINDIRSIKSLQSEKTEKPVVFILSFSTINSESQNALLKMIEEPSKNTYFIFIFPNIKKLLSTLQSRLSLISISQKTIKNTKKKIEVDNFIDMNLQQRLDYIKKITDKKSKIIITRADILSFLNNLETRLSHTKTTYSQQIMIESIFNARDAIHKKSSSIKMILEMLAINI